MRTSTIRALSFLIWLYATSVQAAYNSDKEDCEAWGETYWQVSLMRNSYTRDEVIDKILDLAQKNKYEASAILSIMTIVRYVYNHKDMTAMQMKKETLKECMKLRGYLEAKDEAPQN